MPSESIFEHPRIWLGAILLVLGLGALATVHGVVQAPLDTHEAYVLETTQQMLDRSDWVLPYFNGEPRLNKPPLNYWLTGAFVWLDGDSRVQPWHGRLPSALAGIGLALLTLLIGARLFGRETALLAALMLVSSNGYFDYAHNARPEMVYAFLCSLGLAAFIASIQAPDHGWGQRLSAYGMWLAYALATLAKGPQIPAMFLLASLLYCVAWRIDWGKTLRSLRPVTGLALLILFTGPWWYSLSVRLPAGTIESSQLGGTLITERWSEKWSAYYLYRPFLKLFTPWSLLAPALIALRWLPRTPRRSALLLSLVYLTMVAMFSLNNHYRTHYLLPGLMPVCLLLAAASVEALRRVQNGLALLLSRTWLMFSALAAATALILVFLPGFASPPAARLEAVLALALVLCGLLVAAWLSHANKLSATAHMQISALMLSIAIIGLGGTVMHFKQDRNTDGALTAAARRATADGTPLAAWDSNPAVFVYYLERPIDWLSSVDEVLARVTRSPTGQLVLITPREKLAELPPSLRSRPLLPALPSSQELTAVLLDAPVEQGFVDKSLTKS